MARPIPTFSAVLEAMGVPLANKFKHGDVVVMKSGGPPMTVDACPGDANQK
jgi:hypothetical protein